MLPTLHLALTFFQRVFTGTLSRHSASLKLGSGLGYGRGRPGRPAALKPLARSKRPDGGCQPLSESLPVPAGAAASTGPESGPDSESGRRGHASHRPIAADAHRHFEQ